MIDIAYCIDENMYYELGVSIASLLANRKGAHYHIRIVAPPNITLPLQKEYGEIMKLDPKSRLTWAERVDFAKDVKIPDNRWPINIMDRLTFPDMFQRLEKIIYLDADTIVMDSLQEAWDLDLGDSLLAAVIDNQNMPRLGGQKRIGLKGSYFISSFLVMNLELMRKERMVDKWVGLMDEDWKYPDQDILNITCDGRWLKLPLRYNTSCLYEGQHGTPRGDGAEMVEHGIITWHELDESLRDPAVIHCQGWNKPWISESYTKYHHYLWWKYAKMTPFFDLMYARYIKHDLASSAIYTYKLFGIIPFMRKKSLRRGTQYRVLGLPIITIRKKLWI